MFRVLARIVPLAFVLLLPSISAASGSWSDRFYLNGPDAQVSALLVHDGALFAGGEFAGVGTTPARRIARFDGVEWSGLGSGLNGRVDVLAEYNGDLIAAGSFQEAGGVPASNIARWDGTAWYPLGDGSTSEVRSLALFNGDLIAGTGGLSPGARVMRWDGTAWTQMGDPFGSNFACLAVYRGELFAGSVGFIPDDEHGRFVFVWRWDGSAWAPLTTAPAYIVIDYGPEIIALQVLDDRLYALGNFMTLDDAGARDFCYWDGTGWHQVASGWNTSSGYENEWPAAILPYEGNLLLGGSFGGPTGGTSHSMALYNGSSWTPLPGGGLQEFDIYGNSGPQVIAMAEFQGDIYVAGRFVGAGTAAASSLARWDGSQWSTVATGGEAVQGIVEALSYWGGRLVVGGYIATAGGSTVSNIAVFENGSWHTMDTGINGYVRALTPYDGGIVAAGYLTDASGARLHGIALWDGTVWRGLGAGFTNNDADAVVVYEGDLIAGGRFLQAGETAVRNVARWDGTAWAPMGNGPGASVNALEVHDGVLYAAGEFTGGVAKWDGGQWLGVGKDFGPRISDLQSTPQGLFACGTTGLWRWTGGSWTLMQLPPGQIQRLGVLQGDLIAAGSFTLPGLPASVALIRWKDGVWVPVEGGPPGGIRAVATHGRDLAVGGSFHSVGGLASWSVALWEDAESPPIAPLHFAASRSGAAVVVSCEMPDGAEAAAYRLYREESGQDRTVLTAAPLTGHLEYAYTDSAAPPAALDYWLEQISSGGDHMTWFGPAHVASTGELWPLGELRVSPNPSQGPVVSFSFDLPATVPARIEIFNSMGRSVAKLQSRLLGPGPCKIEWDGRSPGNRRLAAGIYWVRLEAGRETRTARFARIR